jgi:Na+/melibiose symporter-like transporter
VTPAAASGTRKRGIGEQLALSCYWFAYNLQWVALLAIVLPSQIAQMVEPAKKEWTVGAVVGIGALFSLVVTPLAGALSDRSASRFGRRRPFLLAGTLVTAAFLMLSAPAGAGTSLALFVLLYLGVQLGSNWAAGPYAALIPDLVPPAERGAASGWMALMSTLGTLAGALVAGQLARPGAYGSTYAIIVAVLLVTLAITLVGVRERPLAAAAAGAGSGPARPPRRGLLAALRDFLPDPRAHRDFYWVLGTRSMIGMGIYSVFSFFQYFLGDVLRVARPEEQASYLVGVIIAAGIPTSLLAGWWSDRVGRKPLVYLSGAVMALAALLFIAAGVRPTMGLVFGVGALFGVGYGAYQAVDWALAVDVLPPGGDAGKDMGIWHVALVLPQVLAPALSGAILALVKPWSLLGGYATVFCVTAAWCILGTVLVSRVRGAR